MQDKGNIMGAEVEKTDLTRLYDIIEPMKTDIATIKAKLEVMPKPEPRPCPYLSTHLSDHKDWKLQALDLAKMLVAAAIIGLFGYFAGQRKQNPSIGEYRCPSTATSAQHASR
jgi:hypothetical protein